MEVWHFSYPKRIGYLPDWLGELVVKAPNNIDSYVYRQIMSPCLKRTFVASANLFLYWKGKRRDLKKNYFINMHQGRGDIPDQDTWNCAGVAEKWKDWNTGTITITLWQWKMNGRIWSRRKIRRHSMLVLC